jgi:predicted acyl esterase
MYYKGIFMRIQHRILGGTKFLTSSLLLISLVINVAWAAPEKSVTIGKGILFEKNVAIAANDGLELMANVFRPEKPGRYPVLISMSIYGKDIHTRDFNPEVWEKMRKKLPNMCKVSSCEYHAWEVPDPEVWVPEGYIVIRVDARGAGKSPGIIDPFSPRQIQDFYDAVEWAGVQPWSNGKVGLAGVSYYAILQWATAALQPPHLTAIAPWEGANDAYRDVSYHGGILSNVFATLWEKRQLIPVQHGNIDSHFTDMDDGGPVGGSVELSEEELKKNRVSVLDIALEHPMLDSFHESRTPDLGKINVPVLSAANWAGFGLHSRGNFSGFEKVGTNEKWLRVHTGDHNSPFYSDAGVELLKQFYGFYLKGENNGWDKRAPISLDIRQANGTITQRDENEWPLVRTEWQKAYLDAESTTLSTSNSQQESQVSYQALDKAITFRTSPLTETIELTGPMAAKLFVSSSTEDMDIFATVQAFAPDGSEVVFEGSTDPAAPVAQGWLRVSHRQLDTEKSKPWQPYHTHKEKQPMTPGQIYEVDVEIWPGQVVLPAGYTLALRIEGKDFVRPRPGITGWFKDILMDDILNLNVFAGSGFFLHNHPEDRPKAIFGGENTLHTGGQFASYLLLPVIPQ